MYPLEAMQSKIWHNGFNENQFKNKVNWFINNQKKSNENFYKRFHKFYPKHRNAAKNVYNYIIRNI